jgi:hypothetical protein
LLKERRISVILILAEYGVWRSLVARLVWDQEVGSSNLPTPTNCTKPCGDVFNMLK